MKVKVNSCLNRVVEKIPLWLRKIYYPIFQRVIKNVDDLAERIMNHTNCRSSKVKHSIIDNINFAQPEPVYLQTDINETKTF